jgi:hypothetical protein
MAKVISAGSIWAKAALAIACAGSVCAATDTAPGLSQNAIGNKRGLIGANPSGTTPPAITITPSALGWNVIAGRTGSAPLNIANGGESELVYSFSEGDALRNAGMAANTRPHTPTGTPQRISQMDDNTPGDTGANCGQPDYTMPTSWWRRFYFNEYAGVGAQTTITAVTISSGWDGGTSFGNAPNDVPIEINLYSIAHATPVDTIPFAALVPLASTSAIIDSGYIKLTVPIFAAIDDTANNDLVVEYHVDYFYPGSFYPGANDTPETHTTLISGCRYPEPVPVAVWHPNAANFHLTMIVDIGGELPPTCTDAADIPWLKVTPPTGRVPGGTDANVSIGADASELTAGTYFARVCVGSNDPATPLVSVPVTLNVMQPSFEQCPGDGDELFCSYFEWGMPTFSSRAAFMSHVSDGYFDNPFDDAHPSMEPWLLYEQGGWAYKVAPAQPHDALYLGGSVISTNFSADQIVVTFTGDPVTAIGGSFWAAGGGIEPSGGVITLTFPDGTVQEFRSSGPDDFHGFTSPTPIASLTIEAPDDIDNWVFGWPALDSLIIGVAH